MHRSWLTWLAGLADLREKVFGGVKSLLCRQVLKDGDEFWVGQTDPHKHCLVAVLQETSEGQSSLPTAAQTTPHLDLEWSRDGHVMVM